MSVTRNCAISAGRSRSRNLPILSNRTSAGSAVMPSPRDAGGTLRAAVARCAARLIASAGLFFPE